MMLQKIGSSKKAVTLIEILIVVVIVGILATFAMPAYRRAQERARDNEAQSMLKLIQHAEKVYRLEHPSTYVSCVDTTTCNETLRLNLSADYWDYSVSGADEDDFCSEAAHTTRSWHINALDAEASEDGC